MKRQNIDLKRVAELKALGLSYPTIAQRLSVNVRTLGSQLAEARRKGQEPKGLARRPQAPQQS